MPRGENPNSRKNLKQFSKDEKPKKNKRSVSEARESGKKGGIKSGAVRASLKTFREMSVEDSQEEKEKMWQMVKKLAMSGDLKAFEIYCDMIGEKPGSRIEISGQLDNPFSGLTEEELRRLAGGDCE